MEDSLKKRVEEIRVRKTSWSEIDDEAGINIDEELDEEEIGARFTRLQPPKRGGRGG